MVGQESQDKSYTAGPERPTQRFRRPPYIEFVPRARVVRTPCKEPR
jgi:hypothetical protein